ncbi:MAG: FAD-linked oxidase, partial [Ferruginibacter sp.]
MSTLPKGVSNFNTPDPWENAHQNFKHHFKPGASYDLAIDSVQTRLEDYNATTASLQWIIGNAITTGTPIRAMGNNWSFSEVAMSEGGMINTKRLNLIFPLGKSSLVPQYLATGKSEADVRLVQCGTSISYLNDMLEIRTNPLRCIRASGGSNGQTVAGATSTGTHGGALFTGAVHDAVVGLHLITGADKHIWLERASYPVVSDEFLNALGATPVRDDEMFNAAIVSFGSFGIIHGLLFETDPLFLLKEFRFDNVAYTKELTDAIQALDINKLRTLLPGMPAESPDMQLYHLEININPFNFGKDDPAKGIYVRTFCKVPCPAAYVPNHDPLPSTTPYGEDLNGIISTLLDKLGAKVDKLLVGPLVNGLFKTVLRAATVDPKTIGEIFRVSRFRGQIASAAFAVDVKDIAAVIDTILATNAAKPFAGGIALRFVKGTPATIAFTRFAKTCVIEMDGVDASVTRDFFETVWTRLEQKGIDYTLHWGKLNFILNEQRVLKMYGADKVNSWKKCREA